MNHLTRTSGIVFFLTLALAACHSGPRASVVSEAGVPITEGAFYYTQFGLRYEKGRLATTNYRSGALIPINTEVVLRGVNKKEIAFALKSTGERFVMENIPKHTSDTITQAFDKILATQPRDLSKFSSDEQAAIKEAKVAVGMSRDAVLASIGYPPASGTPSLDDNSWKYWDTRFNTFLVQFEGGRVTKVVQ